MTFLISIDIKKIETKLHNFNSYNKKMNFYTFFEIFHLSNILMKELKKDENSFKLDDLLSPNYIILSINNISLLNQRKIIIFLC